MTVFLLRTEADRGRAERLARAVERRESFVDEEDGFSRGREFGPNDKVLLLWSADAAASEGRAGLERRAIEAWSQERLFILRLDEAPLPIGLRDLPDRVIGAHADGEVIEAMLAPPASMAASKAKARKPAGRPGPRLAMLGVVLVLACGGLALAGGLGYAPPLAFHAGLWGSVVLGLLAILALLARVKPTKSAALKPETSAPEAPRAFFVYAPADATLAEPLLQGPARVWSLVDERSPGALVSALRAASVLCVGASPAAFADDHVKRATLLADLAGVPLLPVYLRATPPNDDFDYFFAGADTLHLNEAPEDERPAALAQALAAR